MRRARKRYTTQPPGRVSRRVTTKGNSLRCAAQRPCAGCNTPPFAQEPYDGLEVLIRHKHHHHNDVVFAPETLPERDARFDPIQTRTAKVLDALNVAVRNSTANLNARVESASDLRMLLTIEEAERVLRRHEDDLLVRPPLPPLPSPLHPAFALAVPPLPLSLPLRLRQPAAAWHGVPCSSLLAPRLHFRRPDTIQATAAASEQRE